MMFGAAIFCCCNLCVRWCFNIIVAVAFVVFFYILLFTSTPSMRIVSLFAYLSSVSIIFFCLLNVTFSSFIFVFLMWTESKSIPICCESKKHLAENSVVHPLRMLISCARTVKTFVFFFFFIFSSFEILFFVPRVNKTRQTRRASSSVCVWFVFHR